MKLFDVYPLFDIEIKSGKGCYTYDTEGNEYLDLYGGHAVISIGHSHPYYINKITEQAQRLTFYSNSVKNSLQQQLSDKLGKISGYEDYSLFLINSGAVLFKKQHEFHLPSPFDARNHFSFIAPERDIFLVNIAVSRLQLL